MTDSSTVAATVALQHASAAHITSSIPSDRSKATVFFGAADSLISLTDEPEALIETLERAAMQVRDHYATVRMLAAQERIAEVKAHCPICATGGAHPTPSSPRHCGNPRPHEAHDWAPPLEAARVCLGVPESGL